MNGCHGNFYYYKNFIYVISTLSSIILSKINDLAQRVHVSEILHYFPNLPHPLKVNLSSKWIVLSIHIGKCPICVMQIISQIGPVILEKKSFECFLPYMGMMAILNLRSEGQFIIQMDSFSYLYWEVSHMLHANYQPNRSSHSGEELV